MEESNQKHAFEDRLSKIGAQRDQNKPQRKKVNTLSSNLAYPASIVGAFMIGVFAVFIARYIRFHMGMGQLAGEDADLMMMIDAGMGIFVGFVFKQLFRFKGTEFHKAHMVGIIAAVCALHNLVHWYPNIFNTMFSPQWTSTVVATTDPNSILFRGVTFAFDAEEAQKRAAAREAEANELYGIGSDTLENAPKTDVPTNQLPQIR